MKQLRSASNDCRLSCCPPGLNLLAPFRDAGQELDFLHPGAGLLLQPRSGLVDLRDVVPLFKSVTLTDEERAISRTRSLSHRRTAQLTDPNLIRPPAVLWSL